MNQNNFNSQDNNGMNNNQPLNNQNFNNTFNQNINVGENLFSQQSTIEPISQVQTQNFNTYQQPVQPPKKSKIGLIVAIILIIVAIIIGIILFNKPENKEPIKTETPNNSEVENNFNETSEKQKPKYSSKYVSKTALTKILSTFSYEEEKINSFKNVFDKVDGRIVDVYYYDRQVYFLTSSNMYVIHDLLFFSEPLNLNVMDNNKIELITDDYIVLSNDKSEFTVYNDDEVYKTEEFSIQNNEYILATEDIPLWDFLHIVKSVTKEGITLKNFVDLSLYGEGDTFGLLQEWTYKFDVTLNSEVKEYIVNSKKSNLNGVLLLENNDLYRIGYEFKIKAGPIHNVDKVWNTSNNNEFFVSKIKESNFIYKYTFDNTGKKYEEEKLALPDNFKVDDIEEIFDMMPIDKGYYIKFKNGDIYSYYGEFEKHTVLTDLFKLGNVIGIFNIEGIMCVVMDDGNIYSIINDGIIEYYKLS